MFVLKKVYLERWVEEGKEGRNECMDVWMDGGVTEVVLAGFTYCYL